jgi:hypothetical protein
MDLRLLACVIGFAALSAAASAQINPSQLQRPPAVSSQRLQNTPPLLTAIRCPVAHTTFSIDGGAGWSLPQVTSGLTGTSVSPGASGRPDTLICHYNAYYSVTREAPAGQVCTPIATGFSCMAGTRPPPSSPTICPKGWVNIGNICAPSADTQRY